MADVEELRSRVAAVRELWDNYGGPGKLSDEEARQAMRTARDVARECVLSGAFGDTSKLLSLLEEIAKLDL